MFLKVSPVPMAKRQTKDKESTIYGKDGYEYNVICKGMPKEQKKSKEY